MKYIKKLSLISENNDLPEGMELNGLKCDNPDCDWSDDTVPFNEYEKSINKPCPKCGENILTQEDYDSVMQIKQAMEIMANLSEEELNAMSVNLSEEEIDQALDLMNQLKMKKIGKDEKGREIWSIGESKKLKNLKRFNESSEEVEQLKAQIDEMSHAELARLWRHGSSDNELLQGEVGEYFRDRLFKHFGGFNPSLSKSIGW